MNEIRVKEVLKDRYNTYFRGLVSIVTSRRRSGTPLCNYSNNLTSRTVGQTMQTTFKLKLQNALNNVNFTDADSPALFVGGRRRNRKKRRPRNGQNRRKNKRGDSNNDTPVDTPVETPESPRKSFTNLDYSQRKQAKVSCLDIEEPIFTVSSKSYEHDNYSPYNSKETLNGTIESEITNDDGRTGFNDFTSLDNTDSDDLAGTYECENKKILPRHHSEDSGVYDDEEDWNQYDKITLEENDSGLSATESDSHENEPLALTEEVARYEEELTVTETHHDDQVQIVEKEIDDFVFDEVSIEDDDDDADGEDVIFDRTESQTMKSDDNEFSAKNDSNKFQLKSSLTDPTELEDETPQQIPLDLLSDDDDDVILFDVGSRSEPGIICNPLYEQTLKEEHDAVSIRSYQVGFKPDFDAVNFIRLPATDKAAKKEMKETSPLIKKPSGEELPCCVIL